MSSDNPHSVESGQDADTATTLKPTPLPILEQLILLESVTDHSSILLARIAVAASIHKDCRLIIQDARKKLGWEKTASEAKREYVGLQSRPGSHANELKQKREKSEHDIKEAQKMAEDIQKLLLESRQTRIREWTQLQMFELQVGNAASDKDKFSTHKLTLQRKLAGIMIQIREQLQELEFHKIALDPAL